MLHLSDFLCIAEVNLFLHMDVQLFQHFESSRLNQRLSNTISGYLPEKIKSICLHQTLRAHVSSDFIHTHPNWKQPKYSSTSEKVDETLLSNGEEQTAGPHSTLDSSETPGKAARCDAIYYARRSGKSKTRRTEKRSLAAQGWGAGRELTRKGYKAIWKATEVFSTVTVVVFTCLCVS